MLEELIRKGPWREEEETSHSNEKQEEEDHDAASFEDWVPQSSQQKDDLNNAMRANMQTLIRDLEEAKLPKDSMDNKFKELLEANKELLNKNKELGEKLKVADSHIKNLGTEKKELQQKIKAGENQIKALKRKLQKLSAADRSDQLQIICTPKVGNIKENRGYTAETHEEPTTAHFSDNFEEQLIPLQAVIPELDDQFTAKDFEVLDKLVFEVAKTSVKVGRKEECVQERRKAVEPFSIERNVKRNKRGAAKQNDDDWEYDTPNEIKAPKRTNKQQSNEENTVAIDGVECATNTWKLLHEDVRQHYKNWFHLHQNEKDSYRYWKCQDGVIDIQKEDLKRIIEEREINTNPIRIYLQMLKEEMEEKKISVGFLDIEASFKAVDHEQKLKEFVDKGGKRGGFRCNELDIENSIISPLCSIFSRDRVFIPVHHGNRNHYTVVVIDNKDKCFYHYNSFLPAKKDYSPDTNVHFQNAMALVKHVLVFIQTLSCLRLCITRST